MKYYKVTLERWGDENNHSYVLGVATDPIIASIHGKYYGTIYRGGKYDPKIEEFHFQKTDKMYLLNLYNGDRENLITYPCTDSFQAKGILKYAPDREFFELDKTLILKNDMSTTEVEECLQHDHLFTEDEMEVLKTQYEKYMRNK